MEREMKVVLLTIIAAILRAGADAGNGRIMAAEDYVGMAEGFVTAAEKAVAEKKAT